MRVTMKRVNFNALPARFREKISIDATSGCWMWIGYIRPNGYGYCKVKKHDRWQSELSHRAIWKILIGEFPKGLVIDHLCRTRKCVNPLHLEWVTRAENNQRSPGKKGQHKTHCMYGHLKVPSPTRWVCPICRARYWESYKKSHRWAGHKIGWLPIA